MEIYKLRDEIPDEKQISASKIAGNRGKFKIGAKTVNRTVQRVTDLKQGVKNPNRVNVFLDGEYAFSLDIAQVVDLGVKIGLEVDAAKLEEFKKASEFGKVYQRALEWVLMRPRSERELRDYLKRRERTAEVKERQKEWQEEQEKEQREEWRKQKEEKKSRKKQERIKYDFDDLIVERLIERGYVDDKKFAEYYMENRFVKKGISKRRLEMELARKGINRNMIDEVINVRNDEEEIDKIIKKKRGKYDEEKLIAYLCRQGFAYDLVKERVEKNGEEW